MLLTRTGKPLTRERSEMWLAYILLLPAVIFLIIFMFYPILYVFAMAFFETNKLGMLLEWNGIKNFITVFKKDTFWEVASRSLLWVVIAVSAKTILGMIIALCLNTEFRGRKIARLFFIVPWASSVPISAMLWSWVLDQEFGLLNHTIKMLGISQNPPVWLGYPIPAFISAIWVDIWIGIPFMALVFLAGMQSIPQSLYDSAYVDGVSERQKFFFITLPSIKQVLFIATLLSTLWTFNDFNSIYILTRGGPAGKTDILITSIYKSGFEWMKFSNAAVMAVFTFAILLGFSLFYAQVYFKRGEDL